MCRSEPTRIVGSNSAPFLPPPWTTRAPWATASATHSSARRASASLIIGPTIVAASRGSPTFIRPAASVSSGVNRSMTVSWTNSRWSEVQTWPARRNPAATHRGAARSRSASSHTIVAEMLPSSRVIGRRPTERCNSRPTAVLPVNEKKRMSGFSTSQRPTSAPCPCTSATWPGGSPASSSSSTSRTALNGVACGGLMITVLPAASAGASL